MEADPNKWTFPHGPWHPDFDPATELAMFKEFAIAVQRSFSGCVAELEILEPGYAFVKVRYADRPLAEVHVVIKDRASRTYRYGLFDERPGGAVEHYFDDVHEGIAQLRAMVSEIPQV